MAALKKWAHFDGFDRRSFDGIADTQLHSLLYSDWDDLAMKDVTKAESSEPVVPPSSDDIEGIEDAENIDSRDGGSRNSKKRKITSKKLNARSGDRYDIGVGESVARRHDLRDIAERGGGGRVMFMFEKISKSKILPK